MTKYIYVIFLIPVFLLSQDDLRQETIDVVKEYSPGIILSNKISEQPFFNDTLRTNVVYRSDILDLGLFVKEYFAFDKAVKLRFQSDNQHASNFLSFNTGNNRFLKTNLKYSNGISLKHNTGFLLSFNSDEMKFRKPYFHDLDGSINNQISLYSYRFLNTKTLHISLDGVSSRGLYWGGLENVSINEISDFIGNKLLFKFILNESSNESFLDHFNIESSYFYNNYSRSEVILSSSLSLKREKSLKKQFFILDFTAVNSYIDDTSYLLLFYQPHVELFDLWGGKFERNEFLLSSKLMYQGNSFLDYNFGFNLQYFNSDDNNQSWLFFPEFFCSKLFDTNKSISINLTNKLVYHSFTNMFTTTPYIDPYYRNTLSREMEFISSGNLKVNNYLSFILDLKYINYSDFLLPFLFDAKAFSINNSNYLNPVSFINDDVYGYSVSPSMNINFKKFNLLFHGDINYSSSKNFSNVDPLPRFKFNVNLLFPVAKHVTLLSDLSFISKRDVLTYEPIPGLSPADFNNEILNNSLNATISVNYSFSNFLFSLECKNLLSNKISFYDGYYENDGRQFRVNFIYKF